MKTLVVLQLFWVMYSSVAMAQAEAEPRVEPPVSAPAPVVKQRKPVVTPPKKKEKNVKREKETEGTEALDRFKTQGPLESHYTFGGDRLEVDPD